MDKDHANALFDAHCHPQTHAIIAVMLGRTIPEPYYVGKAVITSDGYCMSNFVGTDGVCHTGAFVGSWEEVEENVQLVAEELSIPEEQTAELLRSWIAIDYQPRASRLRRPLTDKE